MNTISTATHVNVQPQARTGVQWREVILFTFLAYSLTWTWQGIKILPHLGEVLTASKTPADSTVIFGNLYYHILGMFGPMLAAIVMRLFVSREGLRGSLGLRQPLKHYLTAVFAPILFITTICLIMALIGAARFAPPQEQMPAFILPILVLLLIPEIIVAFGEEYGWRGYLLPRLMPLGEIRASLILGIVWALWHTPVLLAGVLYGGNNFWLALPIFVFTVTMSTFAYTWLGRASHHSSTLASIFHGSSNWFANKVAIFLAAGSLLSFGLAMGIGWMLIVLTVYGIMKRLPQVELAQGN
jgi:membrane protease YdiL (CAAX protease family)